MANLKLLSPWVKYVKELEALFLEDPTVHVVYDEDNLIVNVYVDETEKADALNVLLPNILVFGDVNLTIGVIPANKKEKACGDPPDNATLIEHAFKGNGAFAFVQTVKGIFTNNLTYVVFKNKVVQYYTDDLGDIYGLESTVYEDIARDVFVEREGVYYCTDLPQEQHFYADPTFRP